MKPIRSLINIEELENIASRSNFRYGKGIAEAGEITFEETNTFVLEANVSYKNGETRKVRLESTPKGLRWKCACSSRKDLFCEHCVAVGISAAAK